MFFTDSIKHFVAVNQLLFCVCLNCNDIVLDCNEQIQILAKIFINIFETTFRNCLNVVT